MGVFLRMSWFKTSVSQEKSLLMRMWNSRANGHNVTIPLKSWLFYFTGWKHSKR